MKTISASVVPNAVGSHVGAINGRAFADMHGTRLILEENVRSVVTSGKTPNVSVAIGGLVMTSGMRGTITRISQVNPVS